jgi:DNA-binding XRE family transcriptional regulator
VSTPAAGALVPALPAPSSFMDDIHSEASAVWLRQIGKRVRILRLAAEKTQDQLADETGISRSFISLIEHGTQDCSVLRLWRIADVLGLSLVELLGGEVRQ